MLRPHTFSLVALCALLALGAAPAWSQSSPYYVGGTFGVSHVSNVYRLSTNANSDRVISTGLIAGVDQRFGRQHLTFDGSVQDNRYSENSGLNNQSYSIRSALEWQTAGNLSGTVSASTDRSLADFNVGSGVEPIFVKNTERNADYAAIARLGLGTRYSLEAGVDHRSRRFSAAEYDRLAFTQNAGSFGAYAQPGGNVRLGLVARRTKGQFPRYPTGFFTFNPDTLKIEPVEAPNDFTRNDLDFTTNWTTGGSSTLTTRISRSRTRNSLTAVNDIHGTTGALSWGWTPTAKLQLNVQISRDTGQETLARTATDLNRIYKTWQIGTNYALTGKVSLNANVASYRSSSSDTAVGGFDNSTAGGLGARWAYSRALSLGCQYNRSKRNSNVEQYTYSASSYGCTGQAVLY